MNKFTPTIASPDAVPPTTSSYWVVAGWLLAGAYPGASDADEHRQKMQTLLSVGIRAFVNLMTEDETNWAGVPFVPYADLARTLCPDAVCARHAIRDLSVPTTAQMCVILDAIDRQLEGGRAVYVHCWGGVGRTGTGWLTRPTCWTFSCDFVGKTERGGNECRPRRRPSSGS